LRKKKLFYNSSYRGELSELPSSETAYDFRSRHSGDLKARNNHGLRILGRACSGVSKMAVPGNPGKEEGLMWTY
jgi:hypothetical protein